MKKYGLHFIFLLLLGLFFLGSLNAQAIVGKNNPKKKDLPQYVPNQIIVKLKKSVQIKDTAKSIAKSKFSTLTNSPAFNQLLQSHSVKHIKQFKFGDRDKIKAKFKKRSKRIPKKYNVPSLQPFLVLTFPDGTNIEEKIATFKNNPDVSYIQKNKIYYIDFKVSERKHFKENPFKKFKILNKKPTLETKSSKIKPSSIELMATMPNDSIFHYLWGLHNTTQDYPGGYYNPGFRTTKNGTVDIDIDAPEAWDICTGDPSIIVAVLDTGLDTNHEDIQGQIWINPGEIPSNGQDDDGNGFVDDYYGYNFVEGTGSMIDDVGHGTHVAGTIAAKSHNGVGITGVAWNSKIMPVRGLGLYGGTSTDLANGLIYAADNGADVINNSWGGSGSDALIQEACQYAHSMGVVLVASAGNSDADVKNFIPASYTETIAVAAINEDGNRAGFSNWGNLIDVTAPGDDIVSLLAQGSEFATDPGLAEFIVNSKYLVISGTSMSGPHVAGLAALVLAENPGISNESVRQILRNTATDLDPLGFDIDHGYGLINAYQALTNAQYLTAFISKPTDYEIIRGSSYTITGVAESDDFKEYSLYFEKNVSPGIFTNINTSTSQVKNSTLGPWNLSGLNDGLYTVYLTATANAGSDTTVTHTVYIANESNWPFSLQGTGFEIISDPVIADLDNNGTQEIIFVGYNSAERSSIIYVLNSDGTVSPGWPKIIAGEVLNTPVVGNFYGRNFGQEIFFTANKGCSCFYSSPAEFNSQPGYLLDKEGNNISGWPKPIGYTVFGGTAIDINNDSIDEIVIYYGYMNPQTAHVQSALKIIQGENGSSISGFPIYLDDYFNLEEVYNYAAPHTADLNGDGISEIAMYFWSYDAGQYISHVAAFDTNGSLLWHNNLGDIDEWYGGYTFAADINTDGQQEIILGASDRIYAFSSTGNIISGFPILTSGDIFGLSAVKLPAIDGLFAAYTYFDNPDIYISIHNLETKTILTGWPQQIGNKDTMNPPSSDKSYNPILANTHDSSNASEIYLAIPEGLLGFDISGNTLVDFPKTYSASHTAVSFSKERGSSVMYGYTSTPYALFQEQFITSGNIIWGQQNLDARRSRMFELVPQFYFGNVCDHQFTEPNGSVTLYVYDGSGNEILLSNVTVNINGNPQTIQPFAATSVTTSYQASTGMLQIDFENLADGTHAVEILAENELGVQANTQFQLTVASSFKAANVIFYPNPMTDTARFSFQNSKPVDKAKVLIYSKRGRLLKTIKAYNLPTGFNYLTWDGRDSDGNKLGNGGYIYVLILKSGSDKKVKRGKLAIYR